MSTDVKTATRTLALFEAFGSAKKPLTLSELADAIRAPVSSCHGLIATLRKHGYVYSVGASRRVYPTRRLFDVAQAVLGHDPLRELLAPTLRRLRDDSGETVILGALEGGAVVYLEVVEGTHTVRYAARPGELKPLHSSAIGKAMLAGLDEAGLARTLARIELRRITPATITDQQALRRDLDAGRARGLFVTLGENVADVMGMAVPVTAMGKPLAVALAGPLERMQASLADHHRRLQAAAREIARLGGTEWPT